MNALTSRWSYAALGTFLAGDAVASAIPVPYVARTMDRLGIPPRLRPAIPVAKAAMALGLLSVFRRPAVARATTAALALYFAVAVGRHVRARSSTGNALPAVLLLVVFTAMTAQGPAPRPV